MLLIVRLVLKFLKFLVDDLAEDEEGKKKKKRRCWEERLI